MTDRWWKRRHRYFQHLLRERDAIGLDMSALVDEIEHMGASAYVAMGGGFSAWYPSRLKSQCVNPFMEGDFLGDLVGEAHRRNIRVVARMDISKCRAPLLDEHPDWFTRTPDGAPNLIWEMPQTCPTGPFWAEENFKIVDEILDAYEIDGFFYNYFNPGRCYCARCKTLARRATGEDVPAPGLRAPAYEGWRRALLADYTGRLRDYIHARRPDVALIPYHHVRDGWDYPAMAAVSDVLSAQISNPLVVNPVDPQPVWTHWAAEEALLAEALKPDATPVLFQTGSSFFASRQTTLPAGRMIRNLVQAAAHGASTAPAFNGRLDTNHPDVEAVAKFCRAQAQASHWYDGLTSAARIGLIRSQASIDWSSDAGRPAGDPAFLGHVAEFRGMYEMLTALHYPCAILPDGALSASLLARLDVVVAPSVSCLSDKDAAALDAFVARGGSLVVSDDFATCDENRILREAPACRSVPGKAMNHRNVSGSYFELADPRWGDAFRNAPFIAAEGSFREIDSASAPTRQDLRLIGPFRNNAPEFAIVEGPGHAPGLLEWSHFKGRTLWAPWRPGAAFHQYAVPEYATLFGCLLNNLAGPPPLHTNTHAAVEFILRNHPDGQVLHIINGAASQAKPFVEPPALAGFEVRIRSGAVRAIDIVSGLSIQFARDGEEIALWIDRLENFVGIALCGRGA